MIKAFKTAIVQQAEGTEVEVLTPAMVRRGGQSQGRDVLVCPLTIDLPEPFSFTHQKVFQACRKIEERRQWVQKHTTHRVCNHNYLGDHWLPIIYTAKGPLYGEVIGEGVMPNSYHQPIDLRMNSVKVCIIWATNSSIPLGLRLGFTCYSFLSHRKSG